MKKEKRTIKTILVICLTLISIFPGYTISWYEDPMQYPIQCFSTTKWLAYEALKLAVEPYEYRWLTTLWGDYLDAFYSGIAAPRDENMALDYANPTDYGDIMDYRLFLDDAGVVVTENNLSVRAQEEYEKLVNELNQTEPDEGLCAFYAGTAAHYVSQAGTWGAIWNESAGWGEISNFDLIWNAFENQIEIGIMEYYAIDPYYEWWTTENWYNSFFSLNPTIIAPKNASEATIELAQKIHPLAEDLGKNFTDHITITSWPTQYKADVETCLEYSVEAIFSFLQQALIDINWKYIHIPLTTIHYNNETGHFSVDEFQVEYVDLLDNRYILNDSTASKAELRIGIFPEIFDGPTTLSPDTYDLEFNPATDSWYFSDALLNGTVANTLHKVFYVFDMNNTVETWSLGNETFFVDYFYVEFQSFSYRYDSYNWALDIWNILAVCDIPEIGVLEPADVTSAKWFLYQKAVGPVEPGTEPLGILAYDTEYREISGNLSYTAINQTWYSLNNDIGWVFTPSTAENYVVIRFQINSQPIGYYRNYTYWESIFIPWAQATSTTYFKTRFHSVTISQGTMVFDPENLLLSIYNITAKVDYTNATYDGTLDWYQIYDKEIPPFMTDVRSAICTVYLEGGIPSNIPYIGMRDLQWNAAEGYWYKENIDLSSLPSGRYFLGVKFRTMNTDPENYLTQQVTEIFRIQGAIPVYVYLLPVCFVIGLAIPMIIFAIKRKQIT